MRCKLCEVMLNTQFHTFGQVPLCENCFEKAETAFRDFKKCLRDLEKCGENVLVAVLRSGAIPTSQNLLQRSLRERKLNHGDDS